MNTSIRPLRVVFILPAFYRNGAVNLVVNLAQQLTRYAISPQIFALRECQQQGPLPQAPVSTQIALKEYQSTLFGLPKLLCSLIPAVLKADVVVHTWENGILIPGIIAFILRKPTLAIVQNNFQKISENSANRQREQSIRRWVYGKCKAIVCVGHGLIATVEPGIDRKKVIAIQNGIDLKKVRHLSKAPSSRKFTAARNNNVPFIIGVGRLSPQKGFDTLIKAHAAVIRQGYNHQLVIIGEGTQKDELARLAKHLGVADSVIFLGYLNNPYPAIAHAALFCLSSRYEGFVLVGAEAAALGVPTIATDCVAGPKELLENGRYGDLVQVDDSEALAIAIQRHLENPQRLQAKAQDSAQNAERLSMDLCAARYSELLYRCIGQTSSSLSTQAKQALRTKQATSAEQTRTEQTRTGQTRVGQRKAEQIRK
ncbi:MAG: glycosyltransferase [Phormidesmis sp.]